LQAVIPEYTPELHEQITATAAATGGSSSSNGDSSSSSVLLQPKRKKKAVPGPAQPTAVVQLAADTAAAMQHDPKIIAAIEQLSLGTLVQALLPTDNSDSGDTSSVTGVTSDISSVPLSAAIRTAVKFRVSKKMLLMDVCVAAGVPLAVLQQYQAGRVAASTCHALPWQEAGGSA
jgi:hypothetical protein